MRERWDKMRERWDEGRGEEMRGEEMRERWDKMRERWDVMRWDEGRGEVRRIVWEKNEGREGEWNGTEWNRNKKRNRGQVRKIKEHGNRLKDSPQSKRIFYTPSHYRAKSNKGIYANVNL